MADYFMHFSRLLDEGTLGNAARVPELYTYLCAEGAAGELPSDGFLLSLDPAREGAQLWMPDDGTGDPQRVIDFVLRCAAEFKLTRRWGFQWANTCSRPRVNAFGGGAYVLDLGRYDTVAWIGTHSWLDDAIRGGRP